MDLLDRNDEVKGAIRALSHALKTRKDLDAHTKRRIAALIRGASKVNIRTTERDIQALINESQDLNTLFTHNGGPTSKVTRGATMRGMEDGTRSERELSERDAQLVKDMHRIQVDTQRINNELRTAKEPQRTVLIEQLRRYLDEQDRIIEARYPLTRGEISSHRAFEEVIRNKYVVTGSRGGRYLPMSLADAIEAAHHGFEKTGTVDRNPFSAANPLNSKRGKYHALLSEGVISEAVDAARRALLDERTAAVRRRLPPLPASEPVTTPASSPDSVPTSKKEPAPASEPPSPQPVSEPVTPITPTMHFPHDQRGNAWQAHPGWSIHPGWTTGPGNNLGSHPGVLHEPIATPRSRDSEPRERNLEGMSREAQREYHRELDRLQDDADRKYRALSDRLKRIHSNDEANKIAREMDALWDEQRSARQEQIRVFNHLFSDLGITSASVREAAAARETPAAGTVAETAAAVSGMRERDLARYVASKNHVDRDRAARWASAPRRWGWKIPSALLNTAVGTAFGVGAKAGLAAVGAAGWGTLPVTAFAAVGLPTLYFSLPVMGAVAAGVWGWRKLRSKITRFNEWDKMADVGYELNKLRQRVNFEDSEAAVEAKYQKIRGKWKIGRLQNLVPALLAMGAGGFVAYEASTGFKKLNTDNAQQLYEAIKQYLARLKMHYDVKVKIPSAFTDLFAAGGDVPPNTGAESCKMAIEKLKAEIGSWEGAANIDGAIIQRLSNEVEYYKGEVALKDSIVKALQKIIREKAAEEATPVTSAPDTGGKVSGSTSGVEVRPVKGGSYTLSLGDGMLAPPSIDLNALESTFHVPVDSKGVWGAAEHMWQQKGFTGKTLTWLTDLIEDYAQDGAQRGTRKSSYFVEGLLDKMTDKPGALSTTLPRGGLLRTEYLFGNDAIHQDMLRRISQLPISELNPIQKDRAMKALAELFESSQQLLKLKK